MKIRRVNVIEILYEHSSIAIKKAMEANLLQFIKASVIPGEEVLDSDEIFRWYCGDNILMRNWVLTPKFTPENAHKKVVEQMEYFKKRKVTFLWWNGPSAQPANLGEIMEEAGMIKLKLPPKSGDMVMDIRNVQNLEIKFNTILKKTGISIRTIQSYKQIRDAADIVIKTNHMSKNFREPGIKSCEVMLQEDPSVNKLVGYIAYVEDVPVAVSSAFYGAGVVGIYNVGTLKKYQHQGIGTAITLAPLLDAQKKGFEIAVLTATTQGFPVYKRIGFKKLKIMDQYFWTPQRVKRFLFTMYFHWQLRKTRKKK